MGDNKNEGRLQERPLGCNLTNLQVFLLVERINQQSLGEALSKTSADLTVKKNWIDYVPVYE